MKKKYSLRLQVLIIFVLFILSVLGLIYVVQTQFLEGFYRSEKIKTLESTAQLVMESMYSADELEDVLDEISISNEVCVRVVSNNEIIDNMNKNNVCALRRLNMNEINDIASDVVENGGTKLFDNYFLFMNDGRPGGKIPNDMPPEMNSNTYIYGLMTVYDNDDVLILVSSIISPLAATISTIRSQFLSIVVIVLIATIILAMFISTFIVKPIKEINDEADNLPKGKYDYKKVNSNNLELSELNETLKDANEQILKADKAKKELLGNVSHDLRTPLTMIVGYGEMIRDIPSENNEDNINVIIDEAKRLSTLVDDLIDVSKSESGTITLKKELVSINDLIENVYHQYALYCKEKDVDFRLELTEDKLVELDVNRIKQVLYNFINNALNYNVRDNKIIILGSEKINNKLRIYVYDNGLGISEENIDLIWDRYYKVDKEHQRHHLGSGIGLSLARELLQLHNLNYGVESKEGEYSKFYFDI